MVRVDGHYPAVVVKATRALKPFQTSELDLGLLVILAATPCWCPVRDLNPEETDFESAVSANCTNRTNKKMVPAEGLEPSKPGSLVRCICQFCYAGMCGTPARI